MTRLEFRVAVDTPRPRAAFAMVGLATATLAITGQLATWTLAVCAAAGLYSFWRKRPAPWQRNAWLLNGLLAACITVAAALYANGSALIVALAHFTALVQGLQLLDARPRRTEFLLVALAIFQVTLGANLTDSAFFPPLLIAFTVAVVWTLVVHTLRAEALEAGEPEGAQRALSRGLERTTLLASLGCVLLSMALFPLLPRVRSGAFFDRGFGPTTAISGFSERVELGELGRIRLDPTPVLRVTTLEGRVATAGERYWRGLAFDHFDGRRWSVTPKLRASVAGDPEIGVDLGGPRRRGQRVVQQLAREPIESGVLFTPGLPAAFRGAVGRLRRDANRSLHASATRGKRVLYHVVADLTEPDDAALAADRVQAPDGDPRLLQLPVLDPRVAELARELMAGHATDAERVRAIENWLRNEGRYTDTPPDFGDGASPLEGFLLERAEGHCEYFASAMVVLLRSAGLPSRIVNGFAGGHANSLGGFVELAQSDAHTWVEVPYAEAGFVRYDPTPSELRLASADALRDRARLSELASAIELWWFRNIVDFDRGHQARAVRSAWLAWHRWRRADDDPEAEVEDDAWALVLPTAPLWGLLVVLGLGGAAAADLRRRRRHARPALPPDYGRALRLLARRGHVRGESEAARDFARRLGESLPPEGVRAFEQITEAYLAERFGGAARQREPAAWRTLRSQLRA